MTFHYTAWDAQSRMCKGELAAEDRSAALRTLQERGFTPISLVEGRVAGGGLPRLPSLARLRLPLALFAALLLLAGVALFLNARRRRPRPAPAPTPSAARAEPAAAPAPVTAPVPAALKPSQTRLPAETRQLLQTAEEKRIHREARFGTLTPETVQPAFEKEPEKVDTRAFRTASAQLLSMVLSGQPGDDLPPLPVSADDDLEADAIKALNATIYVFDDDSEETLAHKARVAAAKEQLRELKAKEGWTMVEYVRAIEAQRKEDAHLKRELYQEIEKMMSDPTVSEDKIRTNLSEINAVLAERGIPPIQEEELGFYEEE